MVMQRKLVNSDATPMWRCCPRPWGHSAQDFPCSWRRVIEPKLVNPRVQLGSKTWPFCADFGGRTVVRATESMGLRVRSSTHNPKVVSSNLTPATISKTCLSTGLRNQRRANWHSRFVAQFAQRVSPTGSSILNSHLLVLCPRCVPPCPRTDQRMSSVGAISCLQ